MPGIKDAWEKPWSKEDGGLSRFVDKDLDQPILRQASGLEQMQSSPRLLIDAYGNVRVPSVLKGPSGILPAHHDRVTSLRSWEEESHGWEVSRCMENEVQWGTSKKPIWFSGRVQDLSMAMDKGNFRSAAHDQVSWHYDSSSHAVNQLPADKVNPIYRRESGVPVNLEREISTFSSFSGHPFAADRFAHGSQYSELSMQTKAEQFTYKMSSPSFRVQSPAVGILSSPMANSDRPIFNSTPGLSRPTLSSQSSLFPHVSVSRATLGSLDLSSKPIQHQGMPLTTQAQLLETQGAALHTWHQATLFQEPHSEKSLIENCLQNEISPLGQLSSGLSSPVPLHPEVLQSLQHLQQHLPPSHNLSPKHLQQYQSEQSGMVQQEWQRQQERESCPQPVGVTQLVGPPSDNSRSQAVTENHNPCNRVIAFQGGATLASLENKHLTPITSSHATEPGSFDVPPSSSGQPPLLFPLSGRVPFPTQENQSLVSTTLHTPASLQILQPPLPPGPPPSSSQIGNVTPLQTINTDISSLLSSLLAQGVISAAGSSTALSQSQPSVTSSGSSSQSLGVSSLELAPIVSDGSAIATALLSTRPFQGLMTTISHHPSGDVEHTLFDSGFKPEVLKEHHDFVIDSLYTSLPHQCKTCGLRCKSQDEFLKHVDWHSDNGSCKQFRSWFPIKEDWIKGRSVPAAKVALESGFIAGQIDSVVENTAEPAVPADEDQAACTLCGEPFEDFYDDETDLWMYKGAVYLNGPPGTVTGEGKGSIVHAKCRSTSQMPDVDKMSFCQSEDLLSSNKKRQLLPPFESRFRGDERQEVELELDEARKRIKN
ncbi:hypothetical protein KP509_39G023900 [Ceratopteris richardii]|uniref:C2H2-type domain-containing protein n=1 Tax=Ceratopteris richardii TaxID=49495 RepID=A0A8T2PZH4_CERRI|nr:hypothetical protein KP509_39G023900 [Ceratopteris richardii]